MMDQDILRQLAEVVEEVKGEKISLSLETLLEAEIAEDSVEIMEFVLSLEDTFGIEISDASIENFVTVGNVVDYLKVSLGEKL